MEEPRIEYLDTITLSDGRLIKRYKHYFSGKMEIKEVYIPQWREQKLSPKTN